MPDASGSSSDFNWRRVTTLLHISRRMDEIEETRLLPEKKVLYQFSARGHDLAQIILGSLLTHRYDAASGYYRSRPLLLTLGLPIVDAFAGPLGRSGGFSDGRDIGVVCNLPHRESAKVLPMAGGVGSQYTPTAGWAQAIRYHRDQLQDNSFAGAIAVVLGGDGSVATNGFWSALTIATTERLPMVFYIEDNGYGLSVPSVKQTPGGNIAENLASFKNLKILDGDGCDPKEAHALLAEATSTARTDQGPVLVRLEVPRLCGHSGQDTQAYKSESTVAEEGQRDPLPKLKQFLVPSHLSESEWHELQESAHDEVEQALEAALERPEPDRTTLTRYSFYESEPASPQTIGGMLADGVSFPKSSLTPSSEPERINMLTAIRRTLEVELNENPRVVVFGEDIGPKGGVHAATMGLQESFGERRVFDTSLSEEGIIGRAVGLAYAGLVPVAEIQFRKYADPAHEQLVDCGTIRWRTANKFAAPIIVRTPGGFSKCGDPWHSVCDEVSFAHMVGWQVAFPSNAADAVGLLRQAMRSHDPTFFFEHRALLDARSSRCPYPGDEYVVPFGVATLVKEGTDVTVVTWGAMLERVEEAAKRCDLSVEILDLRTIMPWDREAVLSSAEKTGRCLIVHEDTLTAGFGAEIAAVVANEAFLSLRAPVERLAVPDVPIPYNLGLLDEALPSVNEISDKIIELSEY